MLIIDDDLNVCKEIKCNLQNELTDVYYAVSVSDGLSKLMENAYALVIMDVYLSETNGMELLQQMRKMRAMPILVLSSKGSTEEKVQALSLGADGVMSNDDSLDMWLLVLTYIRTKYIAVPRFRLGGLRHFCLGQNPIRYEF